MTDSTASPSDRAVAQPLVAYYRVSTTRQGLSGLGLEAQRQVVHAYAAEHGRPIVGEFVETQSGTAKGLDKRAELRAALDAARAHRATLIVAKLDRLARDAAFVLGLRAAGVEFIACDFPAANRMVITIIAAVAEYEASLISERTRAALAVAKQRGVKLGGAREGTGTPAQAAAMRAARTSKREARHNELAPIVLAALEFEDGDYQAAADSLNRARTPTPTGRGEWYATSVRRFAQNRVAADL